MKLGIKGHETHGDEIIKILEMLGGKNRHEMRGGIYDKYFYYIDDEYKDISYSYIGPDEINGYKIFSLDEFLEKFPYKVGDKVNVWVNYEHLGGPRAELEEAEIKSMRWNSARCRIVYKMKDINREFCVEDIKGKVDDEENLFHTTNEYEEIVENSFQGGYEKCKLDIQLNGYELPEGHHFVDENGNVIDATKILIKKNSPTYPKTYEECCEMLNTINSGNTCIVLSYLGRPISSLAKLIIIRDAYWKIAGEKMGLGKPWEPDWDNLSTNHEFIKINKGCFTYSSRLLVFPTIEMRDEFYNNFKFLIEQCKELL